MIREECKLHKSNWLRLETWEVSEPKLQEEGKEEIYKLSRKSYVLVSVWSLKDKFNRFVHISHRLGIIFRKSTMVFAEFTFSHFI